MTIPSSDGSITQELLDSISSILYKIKYGVEYSKSILQISESAETLDTFGSTALDIIDIIEDSLPYWPHSKSYFAEINEDMAGCIVDDMHHLLDSLGVPRGTFGDEHLHNFIAMYNDRGKVITALEEQVSPISKDSEIQSLKDAIAVMNKNLIELANWPNNENAAKEMRAVAASMIDPTKVKGIE